MPSKKSDSKSEKVLAAVRAAENMEALRAAVADLTPKERNLLVREVYDATERIVAGRK